MSSAKYVLTKYERILRVERVEYTVEIPEDIKNRKAYAVEQIFGSKYTDCKVVGIPFSEMLEEEIHSFRKVKN